MGEIVVDMFMTLDGIVQAPGGRDEDGEGGFQYGGWQGPLFDDEQGRVMAESIPSTDAVLLGRKTYDIFAAYWPHAPADDPFAVHLNRIPKFVASRTRTSVDWTNSQLIKGELAEQVAHLKQQFGQIHTIGSSDLVHTLLQHDLVDRFNLWLYPLILGTGKRLFVEGAAPTSLALVSSRAFGTGALWLVYQRAGEPTFKDMS
jgi:dihydrofolate reductase